MKVSVDMCYTQLLLMMSYPSFNRAATKVSFSSPEIEYEGVAGYIRTLAEFEVADLSVFTELWQATLFGDGSGEARMKIRAKLMKR